MALVPFLVKSARMHGRFCTLAATPERKFSWNVKNHGEAQYCMCGPVPFVNRIRAALHTLRVQERNILFEQWD